MKTRTRDARLVNVFEGAYQDAAFLASLLVGSGIEAILESPIPHEFARSPRVLVHARDLDEALSLVKDFEQNGTRAKDQERMLIGVPPPASLTLTDVRSCRVD